MIDAAVAAGVTETDDLDWKSRLPPAKGLPQTDFPKDVAAMANSGGGIIVFGVSEEQKAATERLGVGAVDEGHERALRSVAITAISPPVFGLEVHHLGDEHDRVVVVEVPASVDGPHLIYKNDYFAAPVRNDADTVWMKERQIEASYRARFEERRHATEAIDTLYREASARRDVDTRAWLIAVAHPRIPRMLDRLSRDAVRLIFEEVDRLACEYAPNGASGLHPLANVERLNLRPGLRRWVAPNKGTGAYAPWSAAWMSVHRDGSVTVACSIGGHRLNSTEHAEGWRIGSLDVECAVADFMALVRRTAAITGDNEYDIRIGIESAREHPLVIQSPPDLHSGHPDRRLHLHGYTPIDTTVMAGASDQEFFRRVYDLALDCVNQGGVSELWLIREPAEEQQR